MSELFKRIEQLCIQKGVSITELCRESGASRGSLTDLKKGRKQSLSADTLSKIAVYFGVSVDYWLGKEEKPAATEDDELNEYLEYLKNREDGRMLFSLVNSLFVELLKKYQADKL